MPEIIYYVAVSLDGFIAPLDGSLEWLSPYNVGDEDYGYDKFYQSIDALIEGRRTYEQALTFKEWSHPGKPCWVVTSRKLESRLPEIHFTSATPADIVKHISSLGHNRIWLVGGSALAGSFRSAGLITEYVLSVVPVLLGAGRPLFGGNGAIEKLSLVEAKTYPNGLVQLKYTQAQGA